MDTKIIKSSENVDIPKESAGKLLYDRFKKFDKDSLALVELKSGETYTYGDLIHHSTTMATNLRHIFQIRKDDIVAVIIENSCKFWTIVMSGLYLATPLHLLNPGYTNYELTEFLSMSKPKLIFCSKQSLNKVKKLKTELDFIKIIVSVDDRVLDDVVFYEDLITDCQLDFEIEKNFDIEDQVAFICNSSGTTGLPKGVMVTHDNFRYNFCQSERSEQYSGGQNNCIIQIIPFYHVYGFTVTSSALYLGAKILILDQFHPYTYLETIQNHKVTKLFLVPSLAHFFAKNNLVNNYDLSSIKEIYLAAGSLPEEIITAIKTKLNLTNVRQTYGLTEMSSAIFMTPLQTKPNSCGKLTPGHVVKVINPKTKELLGANCSGEICVKGGAMKGYLNDPEKTKATIDSDGFVHTGDIGYYDDDGFFFIVDRLKDLIKYKSFQVAPAEIEEVLLKHVGIRDCAVVGKPDERYGELSVAFVVKREGTEITEGEIVDYVARHFCVEKRLHGGVKFLGEIPRNNAGKILRRQLRDML